MVSGLLKKAPFKRAAGSDSLKANTKRVEQYSEKNDNCSTFLILWYTKSTHPCKIEVTKPNQKGNECFMFKKYTINQTTLPLDMEQYIPETDGAFAGNASLVEAMP